MAKSNKNRTKKEVINESESEHDFSDSDSEDQNIKIHNTKKVKSIEQDFDSDSEDFKDLESGSEDERLPFAAQKKASHLDRIRNEDDDQEQEFEEDEEEREDEEEVNNKDEEELIKVSQTNPAGMVAKEVKRNRKLKKLTPDQLDKEQKRIKKTGVCYLSKVPPYMKPSKLRSVLSRFGKIDRLFLKPEDNSIYHKRVKYGGNKKKNFTEGWIEFVNKKDAKLCASTLNANILGGKKTSYYYDDVINMKYLSGFKWFDLTQQIAKENEVRQAKLQLELSQQQKLNKSFVSNVEKSKMISGIQRKRKAKAESDGVNKESDNTNSNKDQEIRRTFKQRKVTSTRADAREELKEKGKPNEKLNDVLSRVF